MHKVGADWEEGLWAIGWWAPPPIGVGVGLIEGQQPWEGLREVGWPAPSLIVGGGTNRGGAG